MAEEKSTNTNLKNDTGKISERTLIFGTRMRKSVAFICWLINTAFLFIILLPNYSHQNLFVLLVVTLSIFIIEFMKFRKKDGSIGDFDNILFWFLLDFVYFYFVFSGVELSFVLAKFGKIINGNYICTLIIIFVISRFMLKFNSKNQPFKFYICLVLISLVLALSLCNYFFGTNITYCFTFAWMYFLLANTVYFIIYYIVKASAHKNKVDETLYVDKSKKVIVAIVLLNLISLFDFCISEYSLTSYFTNVFALIRMFHLNSNFLLVCSVVFLFALLAIMFIVKSKKINEYVRNLFQESKRKVPRRTEFETNDFNEFDVLILTILSSLMILFTFCMTFPIVWWWNLVIFFLYLSLVIVLITRFFKLNQENKNKRKIFANLFNLIVFLVIIEMLVGFSLYLFAFAMIAFCCVCVNYSSKKTGLLRKFDIKNNKFYFLLIVCGFLFFGYVVVCTNYNAMALVKLLGILIFALVAIFFMYYKRPNYKDFAWKTKIIPAAISLILMFFVVNSYFWNFNVQWIDNKVNIDIDETYTDNVQSVKYYSSSENVVYYLFGHSNLKEAKLDQNKVSYDCSDASFIVIFTDLYGMEHKRICNKPYSYEAIIAY